jgi:uncharacterized membrane protein
VKSERGENGVPSAQFTVHSVQNCQVPDTNSHKNLKNHKTLITLTTLTNSKNLNKLTNQYTNNQYTNILTYIQKKENDAGLFPHHNIWKPQ